MKRIIKWLYLVCAALVLVSGCRADTPEGLAAERITFRTIVPDPPSYVVCIVSSDCTVIAYDFTYYWLDHPFDYFADSLPPENEYETREYRISQSEWEQMVQALEEERFMSLPSSLDGQGYDGSAIDIVVMANGIEHRSGGYMPENAGKEGERLRAIADLLGGILKQ